MEGSTGTVSVRRGKDFSPFFLLFAPPCNINENSPAKRLPHSHKAPERFSSMAAILNALFLELKHNNKQRKKKVFDESLKKVTLILGVICLELF